MAGVLAGLSVATSSACPPPRGSARRRELGALRRGQVWLALGVGAIGGGGFFAFYTNITPVLTDRTGLPLGAVPVVLGILGLGMVAGNVVASFNLANALGAALGGAVLAAGLGLTAPMWVAVALTVAGVALLAVSAGLERRAGAGAVQPVPG